MVSIPDFWRLMMESRLLTVQQVEALQVEFAQVKGAARQGNANVLVEWLVTRHALSRYQAKILSAGRSGPFFYGDYKVHDRLESDRLSGMFRAIHVATGHPVLLQFLTGLVTQDPRIWTSAAAHAQKYMSVRHPHLVQVHELVDLVSFKFLVLEDLTGRSLQQQLAESGRLAPADACRLARQLALALACLHGQGQVHGDLRPHQVWVTSDGYAKLLVDPLRPADPPQFGQASEELLARADYLAPEFTRPGKQPDRLTDIYALGCLLYQSLSGQPPFAGGDVTNKLQRHAKEPIAQLERWGVPQPVSQLVTYLMAKNPSVRFQNAEQVAQQLEPFVDAAQLRQQPLSPATLPAFEAALQHKQAILLRQAMPAPSGPPAPTLQLSGLPTGVPSSQPGVPSSQPVGPSSQPVGPSSQPGTPAFPVAANSAARPVSPLQISNDPSFDSSERRAGRTGRKSKSQPLLWGAGLGGGAAVGLIVLLIMFGGGNKPSDSSHRGASGDPSPALTPGGDSESGRSSSGGTDGVAPSLVLSSPGAASPANSRPVNPGPTNAGPTNAGPANAGPTNAGPADSGSASPGPSSPGVAVGSKTPPPDQVVGGATASEPAAPRQAIVPDDGQLLWASPTSGSPLRVNYFPPGAQVLLALRPAEMLESEQGRLVLEALGPELAGTRAAWEAAAGVTWDQVEQLGVGFFDDGEQLPRPYSAVWLRQPLSPDELLARWGNPAPEAGSAGTYFKGNGQAYVIPGQPDAPTFVMGHETEIKEALSLKGAVPPLRRGMGPLLNATDSDRHFTLIVAPNYLSSTIFRDGRNFFFGSPTALRQALEWLLGDEIQTGMVSMHFGDQFYWELRLDSTLSRDYRTLASEIRDRLAEVPDAIERHIVTLNPHPYWRMVAFRYPGMVRFLHHQARIGVENEHAVVNGLLPGMAAHNLVFGGEMVLGAGPGTPIATVAAPAASGAKTVEEVLELKMDLVFDQTSLEFAMRDLAVDANETHKPAFDFQIKILGDDLKLDGITRNQQIRDFNQKGQSVADILTALVMKANPVTTVKESSEMDQKLIWVVAADPDDASRKVVLITTRNAATTKNYPLPAPFRPKS